MDEQSTPYKDMHSNNKMDATNRSFIEPVFDRLTEIAKKRQEKLSQMRNDENIDPKTGKPYFHP